MTNIGLYVNPNKIEALRAVESAAVFLHAHGATCMAHHDIVTRMGADAASKVQSVKMAELIRSSDVVLSFGGDGTMLNCAHHLVGTDIPIMGVNIGKLGFLAEFSVHGLEESLAHLLSGDYRVVDRSTLCTTLSGNGEERVIHVLNEFVLEKHSTSRMIHLRAEVDQHIIGDYRADGLLLTTPTGSTAYSLSCGGPIITPSAQVFCLTPVSPHTLTLRPLIINDTSDVRCVVLSESADVAIVADGQHAGVLHRGEEIVFRKSSHVVKLIKKSSSTYFDLLREKLLWSADAVSSTR
ncbi:MAG: NAD(+)/NADH kinase [Candidatus Kapaibacterium sp.]